ncbi:hypothetical protein F6S82_09195 [Bacteroides xylanisolvens]|uniref:Uncharacterized protein n=1 Tax=Bacteroides xylanisolvens TaxID=371601 RepID=A0AAI9WIX1_9BACE|nr:hypothetical protein [Bacteroides xylanisolvens]KAA9047793.1 hypothetical protein F6S82_09195 [Bacteroides xylanisolvens]
MISLRTYKDATGSASSGQEIPWIWREHAKDCQTGFPRAMQVLDRFMYQKLVYEADTVAPYISMAMIRGNNA